ncbi:outer membrane scaffolding protein for murein synthesis (MipA/OmpV family) [Duganella sp. 1224]|uniref:MipA/OmpV family protein n=1 Tax=Duganella sp. 1224 TaxID=2587052 RepID=UPI0015C79365|nr:MipA/OmpV family protein [Duganella sp. 1224]NYE60830.1 outer membrane scaffolding protein for murein synthesis (MipA/OmpV family) [Duganella sp. 1224]
MRHAITLTLLSLCAFSGKSFAADAADTPANGDSFTAGLGLAYVPEYAGANKRRVLPLPILERTYSNGVFLSAQRGIGYQAKVGGFTLSAALGYDGGRDDHKKGYFSGSDALRGMGDIDGSAQAVLSAGYQLGSVGLTFTTRQNIGHRAYGASYALGMSTALYTDSTDQIGFGASAVYADNKRMQTYFGVTATQSARSGYREYKASGGFEHVSAGVHWNHVLDANWSVRSAVGVDRLTGDAADSPLTRRKTTPMLMTALIYRF